LFEVEGDRFSFGGQGTRPEKLLDLQSEFLQLVDHFRFAEAVFDQAAELIAQRQVVILQISLFAFGAKEDRPGHGY